jgi:hypothetical protein
MGINCLIFSGNTEMYHFKTKNAGPYRIASQLRNNGYTVQVVDICGHKKFDKVYQAVLKKFVDKDTYWIGFSTNFMMHILGFPWVHSKSEIEHIRKNINSDIDSEIHKFVEYSLTLNPNVKFLIGGVRLYDFDHLNFYQFRGHTDNEIVDFTKKISLKENLGKKIIYNKEFDNFVNSKIQYTKQDILCEDKALPVEISRGCIFKCKFCAFPLNGKKKGKWIKKYEILLEELIQNYEQFGVTHYVLTDDTYNDSVQKVEDLYNYVYSKLPFKITFTTYLRLDLLITYPHTAEILKESGLKSAIFGIETINHKSAKVIGKGMDPMKQIEFLQKHRNTYFSGINLTSGWIIGLPYETKQTILEFVKWIPSNNNPLDMSFFSELKVRPENLMEFRLYRSEFDMNYSQYFDFYLNSKQESHWKSKVTDIDSEWCEKINLLVRHLTSKNNRTKIGDFNFSDYVNIGVPIDELTEFNSHQIRNKYDKKLIYNTKHKKYLNSLLNL